MKDIPGYEGLYSISENGEVFSHRTKKFLKPCMTGWGYLQVGLRDIYGKRKTCLIHKLVALTYIPNPNNLSMVDHIDRNKLNNSVENLRWVSVKENNLNRDWEQFTKNARESYFNTSEEVRKERARKVSQTISRPVEMRDKNNHDILIKTYSSCYQAAIQEFGDAGKSSSISKCAHGKAFSAYGYFWTFVPTNTDPSYEKEKEK